MISSTCSGSNPGDHSVNSRRVAPPAGSGRGLQWDPGPLKTHAPLSLSGRLSTTSQSFQFMFPLPDPTMHIGSGGGVVQPPVLRSNSAEAAAPVQQPRLPQQENDAGLGCGRNGGFRRAPRGTITEVAGAGGFRKPAQKRSTSTAPPSCSGDVRPESRSALPARELAGDATGRFQPPPGGPDGPPLLGRHLPDRHRLLSSCLQQLLHPPANPGVPVGALGLRGRNRRPGKRRIMPAGGQRAREAGRCQTASTIRRDHHARGHVPGRNLALPHGRHLQEAGSPADNSGRPPTGAPCGALAPACPGTHVAVGGGVSFGSFAPLQSSWPHPLGQHGHDPAPPAYPHADHAAEVGRGVRQGFHPVHPAREADRAYCGDMTTWSVAGGTSPRASLSM